MKSTLTNQSSWSLAAPADFGCSGCRKSQFQSNPVTWERMRPLRMLCMRRSHAGEGQETLENHPLIVVKGFFYRPVGLVANYLQMG
jgi:hypothetical protein